ncbi:MAG TPA: N,N-dimethylformamidase beta subunit family domain-containing protein [Pirellulales bacterium]|nr:N,N-dimethylformamidase beta subunit family domain-containing protein [Pirellulales bacterium]
MTGLLALLRRLLVPRQRHFRRPPHLRTILGAELLELRTLLAVNPIVAENQLPGTPESQWDIVGMGDQSIQGYTTDISYDVGQTVQFKIDTDSAHYRLDIYRMGYYQGDGARLITSIDEQLSRPQIQPDPITDPATQANDYGDWSVSATWNIPATAVSGIYFAKLVREDNLDPGGASHVVFIVRNDASHSDVMMQASVTTWEAYNSYGGNSLYAPSLDQRAFAVSFNRPFDTRATNWVSWVFSNEYPTIRFLESNGYDVTYSTDVDTDRYGSLLKNHKIFLSVGHDEYWSAQQRANLQAARDAGVNLAFFSGNEVFWKTRWEDSFDGSNTAYRTMVCYKETLDGTPTDPADPPIWTGSWRDPRFSPPADGGRPENALTGTLFMVNSYRSDSIQVPQSDGLLRFWRNTSIATMLPGQVATLPAGILGYEWDVDADNGFRPAGEFDLSHTTISLSSEYLLDYGGTFGAGTATHSLAEYRAASGALVFSAGTINWGWGLDSYHDGYLGYGYYGTADVRIQQACVNLFADMGVQPGSLVAGLVAATQSNDHTPPVSHITSIAPGFAFVQTGGTYTLSGTAADSGGGVVAGVEVSTDGGATWHPAVGRDSWTYSWTADTAGATTILSRSVDDSGNLETPSDAVAVTVVNGATTPPQIIDATATIASTQSLMFSWTTDKPSTSMIEYGTSPTALNQTVSNSSAVTSHQLTLANLAGDTTYYYRLGSTDSFSNTAWSPALSNPPASTTTPGFLDTTDSDFGTGTNSGTYISQMSNGEVILSPTAAADFTGTSLPAGWAVLSTSGGSATVRNGLLTVSGTHVGTTATYGTGRALDFEASFDGAAGEHIGFGVDLINTPWAIFSTGSNGGAVYARASGAPDVLLTGNWLGAMHHFRIDWEPSQVVYSIDGAVVATEAISIGGLMRPLIATDAGSGGSVQVDWMHMSSYASSGAYVSRVFDAGAPVVWDSVAADTAAPAGTAIALDVRMGNTSSPDGTWTDFIPLPNLGAVIGGTSRYLQYRADLSATDSTQTPVLSDVGITYNLPPDTIPPRIADRTPLPGATGVAVGTTVSIEFSELMNASTINSSSVYLRANGSSTNVPATVTYSGSTATLTPSAPLTYNTTYNVTVLGSVTDSSGNPLGAAVTWSFTTTLYSYFTDTTVNDFADGAVDANGYLSQTGNGEVMLAPTAGAEFSGSSLASGWAVLYTQNGGTATVSGGLLTVNNAHVGTNALYSPGRSLEFEANFDGTKYQHVGFGVDYFNAPWAIFSTGANGGALYARASGMPDILLPGSYLGAMHDYRIDWNAGSIIYWIDGVQVATQNIAITTSMRPLIADDGGGHLVVDWIRLTPYAASSTYVSRILDGGQEVTWGTLSWDDSVPASTALAISVRMGNTATPDSSWTGWDPVASSGAVVGGSSRYLQYQAVLTTTNVGKSPALDDVTVAYNTLPDTRPPAVVSQLPASGATSVDVHAAVSIGFSKLMNASTINTSTVYLQAEGSSTSVPATVSYSGSTAILTPSAPLAYNTTYNVTVSGSVADTGGNPLGSAVTWSFTTARYSSFTDTTAADFAAGTPDANGYVAQTGNGEVMLAPTAGTEFSGSSLSTGWAVLSTQSSGSAVVFGGLLTVQNVHVGTNAMFGPGISLEFEASFDGTKYEHIGFGVDYINAPWAIFSTGAGGALYARASGMPDILLSGNYLGAMHHYRIDWNASSIVYWIDGVQVATENVAFTTNMRPLIADDDGGTVTVDWMRLTPYTTSSTFVSRVFDGGQTVTWGPASWDDSAPSGTSIAVNIRMGNTATPDGRWSSWIPVTSSGSVIGGSSRYFQYQALLSTTNVGQSPALDDLTLAYNTLPDTTPPTIISHVPAAAAASVDVHAAVSINFSKLMDPSTITTSMIYLEASGSTTIVPATVSYSGSTATLSPSAPLAYDTTYNVTVLGTVADTSGNTLGSTATWSFTTVQFSYLTDTTSTDFAAGSLDANGYISQTGNGEVTLAPTAGTEFSGASLSTGWAVLSTQSGGSATLAGGLLTVDKAHVGTNALFVPGGSLDFEASFGSTPEQHIGFGIDYINTPWAIFSTGANGGALYARALGMPDILLPGNYLDATHHYRIDWNASSIVYWVDGVQVAIQNVAITASMRPLIADDGGGNLTVDWMRLTPYAPSSTFVSRVFDGGQTVTWGPVSWDDSTPSGTSIAISVRMGNTATPDASWTGWVSMASSGATVGGGSRYLQYQAVLSSTNPGQSPALNDFTVAYNTLPDTTPPTVVSHVPASGAASVGVHAAVSINFSKLMDPSTITPSTIYLQASGSSTIVPAAVSYSGATATLTPSAPLAYNTTYNVTVLGTVADTSGNTLGSAATWSFTTVQYSYLTDTTAADFAAGTLDANGYVSQTGDGEVILAPTAGSEFSGSSLPSGWAVLSTFSGGSATLTGGLLTVDNAHVGTNAVYGAGSSLEFEANFGGTKDQHVGFGVDYVNTPWAIFSTGANGGALYARASGMPDILLSGSYLGAMHHYRIDWNAGSIVYWIDGVQVATQNIAISSSMRPLIADEDGGTVVLDWMRMAPYAASSTFVSRVFDGGQTVNWGPVSWDDSTPAGTSIVISVRMGNTAAPDGSWTGWTTIASSGAILDGSSRYIQYRAVLSTTDTSQTPALDDLAFGYND